MLEKYTWSAVARSIIAVVETSLSRSRALTPSTLAMLD
jgi:hypothetical protein